MIIKRESAFDLVAMVIVYRPACLSLSRPVYPVWVQIDRQENVMNCLIMYCVL